MKKRGIKLFWLVTLILLFLMLFPSCNKKDEIKQNKTKKVTLKIHAWEGYVREYEEDFRKYMLDEKKVSVTIKVQNASGLVSFIKAAKEDGYHLISPANDLLVPLNRKKLIKSIDLSRLKNFVLINPLILKTKAYEIDSMAYAVPFNFGPYAIAYNKNKMAAPESYKIFWDPKYKKRVTISGSYDTINIYMTALMLGIPKKDLFHLSDKQLISIKEKLRELFKTQIAEFWEENLNPENHEKFDLGMDWGIGVKKINEEYKGNWGYVIPNEGATGWIDTWAITKNVTDPEVENAVYEYINFMIGSKIQAKVARVTSYAPVNPYSVRYFTSNEKRRYYLTDPKFLEKIVLWQPLDAETLERYQRIWTSAKEL